MLQFNFPTRLIAFALLTAIASPVFAQDKVTFDDHVKPILRQRCASCHNPNKKSAGLDLTNYTNLMQGGAGGESVVPGDPDDSYLYTVITHAEEPFMPPSGNKIPDQEIATIQKWISAGALETKTSVAKISKPKFEMAAGVNPNARPEVAPLPPRLVLEPEYVAERPSNASAIATSPWAPVVAVGMARQVLLYDTTNRQLLGVLPYPEGQVYKLKFSRNGSILIAGGGKDGASGNVVGWDIRTGDRVFEVGDEIDAVMAADISTDHSMVALGSPSKMIRVYSTSDASLLYEIKKHTEWITAIEFSPDGVLLATGDRNGGLHIWEGETGNEYLTLKGHSKQISAVSWRVDGNILASTSEDTTTKLWEMENGKQVKSWGSHGQGSTSVDFTRDGQILTAGRDRQVKLWKQDGSLVQQFGGLKDIAISCAYCDETHHVLGGDWSGQLRLWKAADKTHLGNIATNPPTLADRVAWFQGYRDKLKSEFDPIKAEFVALQNQVSEISDSLSTTNVSLQNTQTQLTETEKLIATSNQALSDAVTAERALQSQLTSRIEAKPLLQESLIKAQEAAKRLPADVEIQQSVTLLQQKISTIDGQLPELQTQLAAAKQKSAQADAKLKEVTQKLAVAQSKSKEMSTKIKDLQTRIEPIQKQLTEKKAKHDELAGKLSQAEKSLARWNGEIAFVQRLKTLKEKLAEAESQYLGHAETVASANAKLTEAQNAVNQAKAQQDSAAEAMEAVQQEIQAAKQK